jgi:arylsulfatase A-like enzyme
MKDFTPNLNSIEGGIYFHNAFSPSTWSPPAYASIFTGLYPTQHGIQGTSEIDFAKKAPYLSVKTFVEDLKKIGYKTVALSRNPLICPLLGFDKGFLEFHELPVIKLFDSIFNMQRRTGKKIAGSKILDPATSNPHNFINNFLRMIKRWVYWRIGHSSLFYFDSNDVNERVINWLSDAESPFFLFITYMDVHDYHFKSKSNLENILNIFRKKNKESFKPLYGKSLTYLDRNLGNLLKNLDEQQFHDETIVIIVSDHGEMLGEEGLIKHGYTFPYKELVHVPLIIKTQRNTEKRIDVEKPISIKDVANIITSLSVGESCLSYIDALPEWCGFDGLEMKGIIIKDGILLHDKKKDQYFLYDSQWKKHGLDDTRKIDDELLKILEKWENELIYLGSERVFTINEEEEIIERLKLLGYVED